MADGVMLYLPFSPFAVDPLAVRRAKDIHCTRLVWSVSPEIEHARRICLTVGPSIV